MFHIGRGVPNREWMKPERRAQRLLGLLIPHRYVNPDQPIGSGQRRGQLTDIPQLDSPRKNETDVHVGLLSGRERCGRSLRRGWDNLNRFENFGSFNKAVNKIAYFSEYLRSTGAGTGEDTAVLDRSAATEPNTVKRTGSVGASRISRAFHGADAVRAWPRIVREQQAFTLIPVLGAR
jgi:hypothetical protein